MSKLIGFWFYTVIVIIFNWFYPFTTYEMDLAIFMLIGFNYILLGITLLERDIEIKELKQK